jgi:hypothetical protein
MIVATKKGEANHAIYDCILLILPPELVEVVRYALPRNTNTRRLNRAVLCMTFSFRG